MRRKAALLVTSLLISTANLVVFAPPSYACAEPDPTIGCIGLCARPLQGSVTCPNDEGGNGNGNGGGKDRP
ncbi:MAG: hypothetical protein ACRDKT_04840 [Actinomycetota bacterium]